MRERIVIECVKGEGVSVILFGRGHSRCTELSKIERHKKRYSTVRRSLLLQSMGRSQDGESVLIMREGAPSSGRWTYNYGYDDVPFSS